MHRRIARFVSTQKNFISRSTAANKHKTTKYNELLYNEKLQSKSLIVCLHGANDKKVIDSYEFKTIRSDNSGAFILFNTNLVLYKDTSKNTMRVLEKGASRNEIPTIRLIDLLKWLAKSKDSDDKSPVHTGGRIGRLDAANEAGFFHRTDRSRLKEIKKKLKAKEEKDPSEPKKTDDE